jgi:uncharacterized protein
VDVDEPPVRIDEHRDDEELAVSPEAPTYETVPPVPPSEGSAAHHHGVPWGVLACLGVLAVTVVAVIVLANVLGLLAATLGLSEQLEPLFLPLPLATLGVVTVLWVWLRHRTPGALGGPGSRGLRELWVGLGLGVAAFLAINVGLSIILQLGAAGLGVELPQPQQELRDAALDPALLPWLLLSAVVVAPLAEEVFFRGMLFQALRDRLGRWGAILLSAVVFAGAHVVAEPSGVGGALVFAMILPLGVYLAWLFERRGSLAAVIGVHAAFNALTVGVMVAASRAGVLAG